MEEMSGIYIEVAFLDATLNFGQSLIVFAIFGMDTKELLVPLLKYWRKIWYGANLLTLPKYEDLSQETKHICDQFVTHHLENCKNTIAKDTRYIFNNFIFLWFFNIFFFISRWRLKVYKDVFQGNKFVDWLLEVGLARDRVEAVHYAHHLIDGRVLKHINGIHHFYDRSFLYTFV